MKRYVSIVVRDVRLDYGKQVLCVRATTRDSHDEDNRTSVISRQELIGNILSGCRASSTLFLGDEKRSQWTLIHVVESGSDNYCLRTDLTKDNPGPEDDLEGIPVC